MNAINPNRGGFANFLVRSNLTSVYVCSRVIAILMAAASFALTDVAVVMIMGLIGFVPFGIFVRGVISDPGWRPQGAR